MTLKHRLVGGNTDDTEKVLFYQQESTTEIERKTTAQPGTIHCLRGRSGGALTIKTAEKDGEGE